MAKPTALTPQQVVQQIVRLEAHHPHRNLDFYCQIGRVRAQANLGYGLGGMAAILDGLAAAKVSGMGRGNLYRILQFSLAVEANKKLWKVEKLDELGLSWRSAARLLSRNLSAASRERMIRDFLHRHQDSAKLGAQLSQAIRKKQAVGPRSVEALKRHGMATVQTLRQFMSPSYPKKTRELAREAVKDLQEALTGLLGR